MKRVLVTGLTLLCVIPLVASGQGNTVTFDKLWNKEAGNVIYGGVHGDNKLLYVGDEGGIVRALHKDTGKEEWRIKVGAPIASNLMADEERVYFHSRDGVVHARAKRTVKRSGLSIRVRCGPPTRRRRYTEIRWS